MISTDFFDFLYRFPIALILLLVAFRVIGNKELHNSTPLEIAYMIMLTSMAWDMVFDTTYHLWEVSFHMGWVTLFIYILQFLIYKYERVRYWVEGDKKLIVRNGKINKQVLRNERMKREELERFLREKGVFDVKEVERAYLETDGKLSVQTKGANDS